MLAYLLQKNKKTKKIVGARRCSDAFADENQYWYVLGVLTELLVSIPFASVHNSWECKNNVSARTWSFFEVHS